MVHPIQSTVVDDDEFERIRKRLEHPVYNPKAAKFIEEARNLDKRIKC